MNLTLPLALTAWLAASTLAQAQGGHAGHGGHGHHVRSDHGAHAPARAKRSRRHSASAHGGHGAHGAAGPQTPSTRELMAAHHKMMRDMNQPYTGDPDADFRIQMIPHHQGAVDMARVALRHAKDPFTRQFAEAIIVEQQREIYDMQNWLARRGYRAPPGGQPRHIIGWDSYRSLPATPGSLEETQSKSWAPGSGVPRQSRR